MPGSTPEPLVPYPDRCGACSLPLSDDPTLWHSLAPRIDLPGAPSRLAANWSHNSTTTTTGATMTESGMFYVAVCRECGDDLEVPFTSASDRGKWCAAHRDGTGHGQWHIFDIPKEATVPDDNVEEIIGVFSLARSGLGWRATVQLMAGEWTVCREWPTVTEAARDAGNELALLLEAGDTDEP